ncbi:hypothetical protein OC845_000900 [Tilletia horrida]|nr:hypothetical protein OC845_000900 [Tilletia horrida]
MAADSRRSSFPSSSSSQERRRRTDLNDEQSIRDHSLAHRGAQQDPQPVATRGQMMENFLKGRANPNLSAPIEITAPVTCQPLNVTWPHIGKAPYTVMVTIEQWTTDILLLDDSYLSGIDPGQQILYQHMIPSFDFYDGNVNPHVVVSVTDSTGDVSNSSAILQVSNGTLTCAEAVAKVDFYIVVPDSSIPSQCQPWTLSWQHLDESPQTLVPPLSIFLLQAQVPPITIRVPDSVSSSRSNTSDPDGNWTFTLPVAGKKEFLTTMSDHGPLGSGGVLGLTSPGSDENSLDYCLTPQYLNNYAHSLPKPTRTISIRPSITPIIGGDAKGIPILISSGTTVTTGHIAYGNADLGPQTIYENSGSGSSGSGGGGSTGPLSTGALIGVVLGAGFFAGALLATLAWLFIRARRRDKMQYHSQYQQQAELDRINAKLQHPGSPPGSGPSGLQAGASTNEILDLDTAHRVNGSHGTGTPTTEMRQTFSDATPTEELSAHQARYGSPSGSTAAGRTGRGVGAAGGVTAAVGGMMSRLRPGGARNGSSDHADSFHSLHSLDGGSTAPLQTNPHQMGSYGSYSSSSMNTGPRTPGGVPRPGRRGGGAGTSSPTSPASASGSVPPFGRDSGGPASPGTDGSWFPDSSLPGSSTYNSSRRGGGAAGSRSGRGTGNGGTPNVVQHSDAGMIMFGDEEDEEGGGGVLVELPPQYDSINVRRSGNDAAAVAASSSGSRYGGGGTNTGSAPNSAGPAEASGSMGSSGLPNWFPHSPTSGSGRDAGTPTGYGSGDGTGGTGTTSNSSGDMLMAHMARTGSAGVPHQPSPLGAAFLESSASAPPAPSQQGRTTAAPATSTLPVSSAAAGTTATATGGHQPSSSSTANEKRPKLKLATPATAAASGLLEDLLRGAGAGPQYTLEGGAEGDGARIQHNHAIDVGEAEPEEWETIPPEVLRRRGVRRRNQGGDGGADLGGGEDGNSAGTGTGGTGFAPASAGTGTGGSSAFSSTGSNRPGATLGVGTGNAGGPGQSPLGQSPLGRADEEDEEVPDESEFWIVPRG